MQLSSIIRSSNTSQLAQLGDTSGQRSGKVVARQIELVQTLAMKEANGERTSESIALESQGGEIREGTYSGSEVARNGGPSEINNGNGVESITGDSCPSTWILVRLIPVAQSISLVPPISLFYFKEN
ncbi:hypothetical protein SUGI_1033970 [Cryptomeria japonica]|nr:hypothetical protein SUGI_1033970 [Cryptomeria japonica]